MGLKQKDLQPYIGSSGIVSEVLNKKRGMSKSMIRKLSEFLHLDQNLLNTPYNLIEVPTKSTKPSKGSVNEGRTVSDVELFKLFTEISSLPTNLSQERKRVRVGQECYSTCRSRWSPYHNKTHLYCSYQKKYN